MHQGNATIRERGRCKTFFMIQKNQRASASSIILCNVYFVSYHFIPNCIATTFSFTQSFLVSLVGAEKPQENSFYFLSSVLSNLNKSGGNFSSISPPGFAKTVGRRGLEWPEWRLGLHHSTTGPPGRLSISDWLSSSRPNSISLTAHSRPVSDKLFPNCLFHIRHFARNPMFYLLPGWLMDLNYHIIFCDRE